jgi:hypothetical protein
MSLLTICNAVCDEVALTRPSTIVGNTADDARTLLRLCNKVGEDLMLTVDWQILRKEQTFTALGQEEQTSILPSDFNRFVPDTFYNRTLTQNIVGPVPSATWQAMKANSGVGFDPSFIYRGGSVFVLPTLTAGNSLAFEYISNQWAQSSGAVGQTSFQADDDTGIIDEGLITLGVIFEYLQAETQPSDVAYDIYKSRRDALINSDQRNSGTLSAGDIFGTRARLNTVLFS